MTLSTEVVADSLSPVKATDEQKDAVRFWQENTHAPVPKVYNAYDGLHAILRKHCRIEAELGEMPSFAKYLMPTHKEGWELSKCDTKLGEYDPGLIHFRWVKDKAIYDYTYRAVTLAQHYRNWTTDQAHHCEVTVVQKNHIKELNDQLLKAMSLPIGIANEAVHKGQLMSFGPDGKLHPYIKPEHVETHRVTKTTLYATRENTTVVIEHNCELVIGGVHYKVRFEGKKGFILP